MATHLNSPEVSHVLLSLDLSRDACLLPRPLVPEVPALRGEWPSLAVSGIPIRIVNSPLN